jgi:orotate phosphoribosyltransferase
MLDYLAEMGLRPTSDGEPPAGVGVAGSQLFSAVGGLTLGADPIAVSVMHAASGRGALVDAFVVRKSAKAHGMQRQIEGPDIAGKSVVVVEDTTTTGGSPIAAVEAVRAVGATVLAVATIVDRNTGAREKIEALGVPYNPIYTLEELTL